MKKKIENVDLGFQYWMHRYPQTFSVVIDLRTGFELWYPKQRMTPRGRQVDDNVIAFLSNVPLPANHEPV